MLTGEHEFLFFIFGKVYFCDQPTNRPTNTTYILIISKLHVGWYHKPPNQPDQPPKFSHSAAHRNRLDRLRVGNLRPTETNQPTNLSNRNQPLQPTTYYYLTYLLLTTYINISVLKSFRWLDGWSVGRIFRTPRISNFVLSTPSFQLGVVGGNERRTSTSRHLPV